MRFRLFVSLHCLTCIDLLPYVAPLAERRPDWRFVLHSNGDDADHREMKAHFGWDFPVRSTTTLVMRERYGAADLPYAVLEREDGARLAAAAVPDGEALLRLADSWKGGESYGLRMSAR